MKTRLPMLLPLILGGIMAGLLLWWLPRDLSANWGSWAAFRGGASAPGASRPPQAPEEKAGTDTGSGMDFLLARQWADAADRILALLERRLGVEGAIDHEAILTFKTEQAKSEDFVLSAGASYPIWGKAYSGGSGGVDWELSSFKQLDFVAYTVPRAGRNTLLIFRGFQMHNEKSNINPPPETFHPKTYS